MTVLGRCGQEDTSRLQATDGGTSFFHYCYVCVGMLLHADSVDY